MINSRLRTFSWLFVSLLIFFSGSAAGANVSQNTGALLEQLEQNRRGVVAENMNLDADQQQAFWELYGKYRQDMLGIERGRFELLREYRESFDTLTGERAEQLLVDYLKLEAQTTALRQSYISKFDKVLRKRQTLRFFQIDIKVDAIIQSEVSSVNPLVEE